MGTLGHIHLLPSHAEIPLGPTIEAAFGQTVRAMDAITARLERGHVRAFLFALLDHLETRADAIAKGADHAHIRWENPDSPSIHDAIGRIVIYLDRIPLYELKSHADKRDYLAILVFHCQGRISCIDAPAKEA